MGPAPDARRNGVAIYDPVGRRVAIFGRISASGHLNDAWAFDLPTLSWSPLETRGTPPAPRLGHDAIYDPQGRQMVVWARQNDQRFFNDTWALDLTSLSWTELSPGSRPQARYGSASIFDPLERRLVTFAGFTDINRRFQDYARPFDLTGQRWGKLEIPGPPPRNGMLTAYVDVEDRFFVFGGVSGGRLYRDVWELVPTAR